jgi:DNA-binding NtrC family response regulator
MATVLYVDDDPAVRTVVRRQLEHSGLQVYTAEGVREAKERIEQMTPDGLFIDIWLGDGTAFELHAWLQEHHPLLSRRVVFVSGDVPGGQTGGRSHTALGCPVLGKPLDVPAMVRLARDWDG